ncbi:YheC/YheD family protein [Neobacillus bataviensis]|uniref:YheC/YheD family protein n=1 Tax=Neobacillus bataviensis TaxID=220685 RepID=UPI003B830AD5
MSHTEVLEYRAFRKMMESYNKIYLKPDQGCKSKGVIRIEKAENGLYLIRSSESATPQDFHEFPDLWKTVQLMTSHTRHIYNCLKHY